MAKAIETLSGADETAFLTAINDAITTDPGTTRTAIGIGSLTPTLHTASPNNTVNALELAVTGGTTNTDLVIGPKGTGAFILGPEPDNTTTGGNKRGTDAVDLSKVSRTNANQVASGTSSFLGPSGGRASGTSSVCLSQSGVASGNNSTAIGFATNASGNEGSFAGGYESVASSLTDFCFGNRSSATGGRSVVLGWECEAIAAACQAMGSQARSSIDGGQKTYAAGAFSAKGDAQYSMFVVRNKTTTNSAVALKRNVFGIGGDNIPIPSGKALFANIKIIGIKSDGTAAATYQRQVAIKNVGGTTSLVGTVNTIGTDEAASTSISITADDTNDALKIEVTGIASETWRWVAVVDGVEVAYGS